MGIAENGRSTDDPPFRYYKRGFRRQIGKVFRMRVKRICCLGVVVCVAMLLCAVARGQVSPEESIKSFKLADGLECTLFAAEPLLVNPCDIDVDARGRVWVCEGANYRQWAKPPLRPEGDRIVILEDTDGDGKADK